MSKGRGRPPGVSHARYRNGVEHQFYRSVVLDRNFPFEGIYGIWRRRKLVIDIDVNRSEHLEAAYCERVGIMV